MIHLFSASWQSFPISVASKVKQKLGHLAAVTLSMATVCNTVQQQNHTIAVWLIKPTKYYMAFR